MMNRPNVELCQWAVVKVRFRPSDRDEHPAVIVSNSEHCLDPCIARVNVLYGSKFSAATPLRPHQAILNSADGLDLLTAVDCSYVYTIEKDAITTALGRVNLERRRALKRTIVGAFRLQG